MITLLLLLSASFHALWNFLVKQSSDKENTLLQIFIVGSLLTGLGAILSGFDSMSTERFYHGLGWALCSGVAEGLYALCLAPALKNVPLGLAYLHMRGIAMLMVWALSTFFASSNEYLGYKEILSVALVLSGLYFSCIEKGATWRIPITQMKWPFLCAVFISSYHLAYDESLNEGTSPVLLYWVSSSISTFILGLVFYSRRKSLSSLSGNWKLGVPAGVFATLSFVIFLFALRESGPGQAITIRNSSVIFAQFLALWGGEKISARQWIGTVAVFGGISVLNL